MMMTYSAAVSKLSDLGEFPWTNLTIAKWCA